VIRKNFVLSSGLLGGQFSHSGLSQAIAAGDDIGLGRLAVSLVETGAKKKARQAGCSICCLLCHWARQRRPAVNTRFRLCSSNTKEQYGSERETLTIVLVECAKKVECWRKAGSCDFEN